MKVLNKITCCFLSLVLVLAMIVISPVQTKAASFPVNFPVGFLATFGSLDAGSIEISSRDDLAKIGVDPAYPLTGTYHLKNSINLGGSEWVPIKNFSGTFDGRGYSLDNLYVLKESKQINAGLFGSINGATIKNVIVNVGTQGITGDGTGTIYVGGLVGRVNGSGNIISNCYVTGGNVNSPNKDAYIGGMVGGHDNDTLPLPELSIIDSFTTNVVYAPISEHAGGLIGHIKGSGNSTIDRTFATGNVTSSTFAGGLIGCVGGFNISNSFATGDATGSYAGGLIGTAFGNSTLKNVYAIGNVISSGLTGGINGNNSNASLITNSYRLKAGEPAGAPRLITGTIVNTDGIEINDVDFKDKVKFPSNSKWDFTAKPVWNWDSTNSYPYPILHVAVKVHTVTFDLNNGDDITTAKVMDGQTVAEPKPDPTKVGFSFGGWHNKANGSSYNFNTPVTSDITLEAKWVEDGPPIVLTDDCTVLVLDVSENMFGLPFMAMKNIASLISKQTLQASPTEQIAIVTYDSNGVVANPLVGFTNSLGTLNSAINGLAMPPTQTQTGSSVEAGLLAAGSLLSQTSGNKRLVLLSNGLAKNAPLAITTADNLKNAGVTIETRSFFHAIGNSMISGARTFMNNLNSATTPNREYGPLGPNGAPRTGNTRGGPTVVTMAWNDEDFSWNNENEFLNGVVNDVLMGLDQNGDKLNAANVSRGPNNSNVQQIGIFQTPPDMIQLPGEGNNTGLNINAPTSLPFNFGVVLGTGSLGNMFNEPSGNIGSGLNVAATYPIFGANFRDAIELNFDVKSNSGYLAFDYFFTSTEYNNQTVNDTFGLWILGTGVTQTAANNVARLPILINGTDIVAINNTRPNPASPGLWNGIGQVYVPIGGQDWELGGTITAQQYRFPLTGRTIQLTADSTNPTGGGSLIGADGNATVRMAIANLSDGSFPSAVFIRGNSVTPAPPAPGPEPLVTITAGVGGSAKGQVTTDGNLTINENTPTGVKTGGTVELTAQADPWHIFSHWEVVAGGITLSPANSPPPQDSLGNPATFTMLYNDVTVKAHFKEKKNKYTVLVLDVSGSMNGASLKVLEKMKDEAKKYCSSLLNENEFANQIAIVKFSDVASSLLVSGGNPAYPADFRNFPNDFAYTPSDLNFYNNRKAFFDNAIDAGITIEPNGTDFAVGLKKARTLLTDSLIPADAEKRIVLLSDGLPTLPKPSVISNLSPYNMPEYLYWRSANDAFAEAQVFCGLGNTYKIETIHIPGAVDAYNFGINHMKDLACDSGVHPHNSSCSAPYGPITGNMQPLYQKVIVACPVDVTISHNDTSITSDMNHPNFTSIAPWGRIDYSGVDADIKTVSIYEDIPFEIQLTGSGTGTMDYTVEFYDGNDNLVQRYAVENVPITESTQIATHTDSSSPMVLLYDVNGNGQIVEMTVPQTYPDYEEPEHFPITVNYAGGSATGYSATPIPAAQGTAVSLNAGTNPGYEFVNWTSSPTVAFADDTDPNTTFTMIGESVTVTANWQPEAPDTFSITVNNTGGGTASSGATPNPAAQGATIALSAGTNPGYEFINWTSNPAVVFADDTDPDTTFTMPGSAVTITAHYAPTPEPEPTYMAAVSPPSKTFTAALTSYDNTTIEQEFIIKNTGTEPITNLTAFLLTDSISDMDTCFEISDGLSATSIDPGDEARIRVRPVNGLGVSTYTDALIIMGDHNTDCYVPLNFTVSAVPTYTITVDPPNYTFSGAQAGYDNTELSQIFTIESTGTESITGLSATLSSTNFIVTDLPATTLTSGSALAISVKPAKNLAAHAEPYTDTLTVHWDNDNAEPFIVNLSFTVSDIQPHLLTVNAGTGGSILLGASGSYVPGSVIDLEASANGGYTFSEWTTSNGGVFAHRKSSITTFTMPENATTITANFTYTDDSVVLYGDVNNDGLVDSTDLFLMLRYFAQPDTVVDLAAADVNYDGVVDSADLILLLRYFAQPGIVLGSPMEESMQ